MKTAMMDETCSENRRRERGGWRARRDSTDGTVWAPSPRPAPHGPARTSRLRLAWSLSGAVGVALLAAACTGGGYGSTYGSGQTTSSGPASAAVVGLHASALGQTLVDGQGQTLYLFEADTAGASACSGGCAAAWPPYLAGGIPQAGTGLSTAKLSTITRSDGGMQLSYAGHPLYRYAGDTHPGDVTGQGLDQYGAKWFVVGASGSKIIGQ
jgi:predicted lipoprotein with Yx(FWY)xxD motif